MADDVLAERYGRTRSSRRRERTILITVAAVFAVVFVAWVVWAGLDGTRPTLEVKDTGHRLLTDQRAVEVRFDLSAPVGSDTACVVQALNEGFGQALVVSSRGGAAQGGASLTPLGQEVLDRYRAVQRKTEAAIAADVTALRARLADISE